MDTDEKTSISKFYERIKIPGPLFQFMKKEEPVYFSQEPQKEVFFRKTTLTQ